MRIARSWLTGLLLAGGSVSAGLPFEMPADGPVPFVIHRIPLEASQMKDTVHGLLALADAVGGESAAERRAIAQIFALSDALLPGDPDLPGIKGRMIERDFEGIASFDKVRSRLRFLWKAVAWLETPEAGIDGQALAACLKDVLAVMNPEHPRATELREQGEIGAWDSWVRPIAAFRKVEVAWRPDGFTDEREDPPQTSSDPPEPVRIRMEQASLPAILWLPSGEGPNQYPVAKLEELKMKAWIRGKPEEGSEEVGYEPFHVSIGSWADCPQAEPVSRLVERVLRKRHSDLPEGLWIEIRHPALDASLATKQSHSLSAVSSVLAVSALSGEPHQGVILGVMEGDGSFVVSRDPWPKLAALRRAEGLRLIVPTAAEEYVAAFLAMEDPGFLIRNEIYTASNLEEVLELSASRLSPDLLDLSKRFAEIRDKLGTQDLGFYLANSFVRQRLLALQTDEPRHLSAKLLALQAVGKRPVSVSRQVLASELRLALLPMSWLIRREYIEPRGEGFGELYERCGEMVEKAAQYARREDQDVVDRANDVLGCLRTLNRAVRSKRGESWEAERDIQAAKRDLAGSFRAYDEFVDGLLRGEP